MEENLTEEENNKNDDEKSSNEFDNEIDNNFKEPIIKKNEFLKKHEEKITFKESELNNKIENSFITVSLLKENMKHPLKEGVFIKKIYDIDLNFENIELE